MYFCFRQNNSFGKFTVDPARGISVEVWIEAANQGDAVERAERIGLYFDGEGDCPCCGDRWSDPYPIQEEAPSGVNAISKWADDAPEGYLHRLDGSVTPLEFAKVSYQ